MTLRNRILTVMVWLSLSGSASAAPFKPVPLGGLTASLYTYALQLVGLAVFLMFLLAGLTYIVPALQKKLGDPVAIIKDAVIGLIILASAYVILNSISPDLIQGTQ